MNAFINILEKHEINSDSLKRGDLTTLQLNLGNLCNQTCTHCHIEASPEGKNLMSKETMNTIMKFLRTNTVHTLDITGGAPELNPDFDYLVTEARPLVAELIVRSNLTVLFEEEKDYLPGFFKNHRVHLICSMPCYTKDNLDRQRGTGAFEKSIRALKLLNKVGYSTDNDLQLDLVYNPQGSYLPASQASLEKDYKHALRENHGIEFNRLLTIANVPIKKFRKYLESSSEYEKYSCALKNNFNPETVKNLMCRSFLSVSHDGKLYDCDFNLALGMGLKDKNGNALTIDKLNSHEIKHRQILTGEHCLACTAGNGSSCQGALSYSSEPDATGKKESVKQYYGKTLNSKKDLKTSACCCADSFSIPFKAILKNIEPEILDKFYGCGSPIPPLLDSCRLLDLGSGTGRDVYIASALAGENGFITGIDMTDEQLEIAQKYKNLQMKKFGFKTINVDFIKGYIENLKEAGIADASQDVVISNCVINLSPDKKSVFREIFRVLKPGGELYFSDVFADRRIPDEIKNDPVLYGECLGGALYIEDFRRMLYSLGIPDFRVISKKLIELNSDVLAKTDNIQFFSMTIRAFKLTGLEDRCEDYGQTAVYLGSIPDNPHNFVLDDHHVFITDKPMLICRNTSLMLSKTRYARHFKISGDKNIHYGLFGCGSEPYTEKKSGGCC